MRLVRKPEVVELGLLPWRVAGERPGSYGTRISSGGVGAKACLFEVCFVTGASVLRFESFLTMPVNAF